jgi:hypothetical protein
MEGTAGPKVPHRQLAEFAAWRGFGNATFVYKPLQKRINRNTLPPGFLSETRFRLLRNHEAHRLFPSFVETW